MIGKMELAKGGTLFLDEVNSLPLEMQAKLLRALQQMEIVRIGDTKPTPVDVRIIAATNEDLKDAVAQGTFRGDLYFRLNVIEIAIPPLRERKADIGYLAGIFLDRLSQASGQGAPEISGPALKAMQDYAWPGNIRELENVCPRASLRRRTGRSPARRAAGLARASMPGHGKVRRAMRPPGTRLSRPEAWTRCITSLSAARWTPATAT